MKLVADTNILITYFWADSVFRSLAVKQDFELISPEYTLEEINKHQNEIIRKSKITQKEFEKARQDLAICVEFIPLEEYTPFLEQAKSLIESIDAKHQRELMEDIDFIALALKTTCPIWTHDKLLKIQNRIKIYSTKEILEELFNDL